MTFWYLLRMTDSPEQHEGAVKRILKYELVNIASENPANLQEFIVAL